MTNIGFNPAANDVVQHFARAPEQLRIGPTATATLMLPGIAVVKDATDNEVKEGAIAGAMVGILGYADANPEFKPATQLTPYARGDSVPVYNGPGRALVYVIGDVVKGNGLVLAANGQFQTAASETAFSIARAAQSRTGAGRVWVNLTGV